MVTWLLLVITCYYWPANPFRALPMKAKAFNYDFFERFSEICCSDHKKSSCPKPRDLQKKYRLTYRRKFRSQTSDNMERWKSRGGKSQRGEDKRWRRSKREKVRREKMFYSLSPGTWCFVSKTLSGMCNQSVRRSSAC